jgi:FAD/FMN-containing dehydrogenase
MVDLDRLRTRLDGELIDRRSAEFDSASRPALAHGRDVRPIAVVRCGSVRDVVRTLQFAGDTHVVPRAGGHCFAGRSSTDGIVLDVSRFDRVTVAADGRAVIGAGARLAQVNDALHQHARAIPGGCGPTVGIAGLTLGGGLGLLGRRYGLTCDRLAGAQVVLADGSVVDCDADNEPDLFWALRGSGGGQFGIVTSLVFDTLAEPMMTRFELSWPAAAATEVIAHWERWAPESPDDITANLTLVAEPGQDDRLTVFGASVGDASRAGDLLVPLVERIADRPNRSLTGGLHYRDLKQSFVGLDAHDETAVSKSRSEFFDHPLPAGALEAIVECFRAARPTGARRALNFTAMGGAYDAVPESATAFAHRGQRFLLEHVAQPDPGWVDTSWELAHPHATGHVYPNFPDLQLPDPARAYHGSNYDRLRAVKRRYDPGHRFHFPQSL